MSIGPVISFNAIGEAASSEVQPPRQRPPTPHSENPGPSLPASGNVPKQEGQVQKAAPAESQLPEDEVELQRDSQLENELIVRYVDKSGGLILQIPSEQTLNFERAIAAEFNQAKPRATTEAASQEGESHGH